MFPKEDRDYCYQKMEVWILGTKQCMSTIAMNVFLSPPRTVNAEGRDCVNITVAFTTPRTGPLIREGKCLVSIH